jgi:hypothetical protein
MRPLRVFWGAPAPGVGAKQPALAVAFSSLSRDRPARCVVREQGVQDEGVQDQGARTQDVRTRGVAEQGVRKRGAALAREPRRESAAERVIAASGWLPAPQVFSPSLGDAAV